MSSRPGLIRRFFGGLWWLLDFTRRLVLNLVFLGLLVILAVAWLAGGKTAPLKDKTALVLDLRGDLVEQYSVSSARAALSQALAEPRSETRLRDVLQALEAAAKDPQISSVVLALDDLDGAGTPQLREIADALQRFKTSGKPVLAWGSSYSQRQYYLAAHADQVWLHPDGNVFIRGFGGTGLYFKNALDKLGVTVYPFQAGKFKSAIEPFTRAEPSPEALEADLSWMTSAWASWTAQVEALRKFDTGTVDKIVNEAPQRLAAAGGNIAKMALDAKLVDGLKTRDEFRALMIERGAPIDDKAGTFRQIPLEAYVARLKPDTGGPQIAVIVAQGEIVDDDNTPGTVGGRATAELIRRARESDDVKALILRIDSPGGSAFASELIRRELELTRKAGKPVIASMGNVAASGGYWIAAGADQIQADPSTITGSIGVFGLLASFDKSLEKLSIGTGGVGTTWLAQAMSPTKPLDPRVAEMVQLSIGHVYKQFLDNVAAARKSTPEKIDAVAQGRVWTGRQAKEHGLVDVLGGLTSSTAAAAQLAKLGDDYRVVYFEREPQGLDRVLAMLFGEAARLGVAHFGWTLPAPWVEVQRSAERELRLLTDAPAHPLRAYAHCLCATP
ncbi:MAG: signal peptide peptidase SppA [Betaproteobacteria bacterium]|jgi:protease-4